MPDSKSPTQLPQDAPNNQLVPKTGVTSSSKLMSPNPSDRETISESKSKMLIICIDRDNDVGLKTGILTPIIGKEACLEAATKLALADPEEADANTIFAAVKEYDELVSKGQECEVATVGGLFERGVLGDKKIRSEVGRVLSDYHASEAVIVSDGIEGEELTPVISTLVPVVSIKKVVIKHSKSVEESYQVLGRYLRMIVFDPRYAKYYLGLPGLILIGVAIAYYFVSTVAPLVLIALIGIVFAIRGFNVDREIESIRNLSATGYMKLFVVITSVFIVIAGIILGIIPFFQSHPPTAAYNATQTTIYFLGNRNFPDIPKILGYFILNSQLVVWGGLAIYIIGAIFFNLLSPERRHVLRNLVALTVLGLLYVPVFYLGNVLIVGSPQSVAAFVAYALFALAAVFVIAAYIYSRYSGRRNRVEFEEIEN
jgi:putative membrane protein